MNGADQDANNFVRQNYPWRNLKEEIEVALEQPECYDAIDYVALETELRALLAEAE